MTQFSHTARRLLFSLRVVIVILAVHAADVVVVKFVEAVLVISHIELR